MFSPIEPGFEKLRSSDRVTASVQNPSTVEEYARLLADCPDYLTPTVKLDYHTGMRQGEILSLTWGQVEMEDGFIRLRPEDTKTNEGRLVPFNGGLREMFKVLTRNWPEARVVNAMVSP